MLLWGKKITTEATENLIVIKKEKHRVHGDEKSGK